MSTSNKNFEKLFMEPTEKLIAVLGNGYVENYLITNTISKGFAVVSNKRIYYKGKHYEKGKDNFIKFNNTTKDQIVDLKDVTGTESEITNHSWMKVLSILFLILSVISFCLACYRSKGDTLTGIYLIVSLCTFIGFIGFLIAYKKSRINMFWILYAGGSIGVQAVWYNKSEIDEFQKQIRLMKDNIELENKPTIVIKNEENSNNSVVNELTKLADLLKDGLITKDEYDKLKSDLLK